MAFTLQWPNTVYEKTELMNIRAIRHPRLRTKMMVKVYRDKLNFLSPALCVQADVLYPNAWAAVQAIGTDGEFNRTVEAEAFAVGCKGHQLDNEFPLQNRTPVALPLLQYPTNTRGTGTEDQDVCALPVLNWETYIKEFYHSAASSLARSFPIRKRLKYGWRNQRGVAAASSISTFSGTSKSNPGSNSHSEEEDDNHAEDNTNEPEKDESDEELAEAEEHSASKRRKIIAKNKKVTFHSEPTVIPIRDADPEPTSSLNAADEIPVVVAMKIKRPMMGMTRLQIQKIIYENDVDLEVAEKDDFTVKVDSKAKETPPELDIGVRRKDLSDCDKLPLGTLRKYKNQPDLKVMGTWNFLYGGTGACSWVYDSEDMTRRNVLVGNGSKLRMASLKPAKEISMLSYVVDSVWEEDEVPTNIRPDHPEKDDLLSDLIFKIVAHRKKRSILATVQRGRSVEIYRVEGVPTLLTSIPNICYGTKRYLAGRTPKTRNPLIVSSDANRYHPSEIVTLDQNHILRFVDFVAEKTTKQFQAEKVIYKQAKPGVGKQYSHIYPEIRLNEATGVVYANHPSTFYQWYDSQIYFYDQRTRLSTNHYEVLSLRSATSSMSWSDQQIFMKDPGRLIDEYVSSVKPSLNSTYYYVGTSSRVLLMDMRVPGNPVLKLSHGMKSAATYLDTCRDDNYEILVAGSQQLPQTFCTVLDYSHVGCVDRPECNANNPILQSYPRHLSNSREFFEFANEGEQGLSWECDYQRAKDHCYAWTTGLCLMPGTKKAPDPRKPAGIILLNGNSFGDLFYQEWDQKPLDISREIEVESRKLKRFVSDWTKAMTPTSFNTFRRPSQNKYVPVDCTLLIEPNAETLRRTNKVRDKPFDPLTPDYFTYNRVDKGLKTVEEQVKYLQKFKGHHVENILRPWIGEKVTEGEWETFPQADHEFREGGEVSQQELVDVKQEVEYEDENQECRDPLFQPEVTDQDQSIWHEFAEPENVQDGRTTAVFIEDNQIDEEEFVLPSPLPEDNIQVSDNLSESDSASIIPLVPQLQEKECLVIQLPEDSNPEFDDSGEEEALENALVIEQNILAARELLETSEYSDKFEPDDPIVSTPTPNPAQKPSSSSSGDDDSSD